MIASVRFAEFCRMIEVAKMSGDSARNLLLLLIVFFQNTPTLREGPQPTRFSRFLRSAARC